MDEKWKNKIIVFCGPSGSGKTTVLDNVVPKIPELSFYVSATSRPKREFEEDGEDYYFLTAKEFKKKVENGEFVEWEEVYEDMYYGTLRAEIDRIHKNDKVPVSDVDVKGAMSIKKIYGTNALVIFIKTPLELIRERLVTRGTETEEKINMRIARATEEFSYEIKCDATVENIDLQKAISDSVAEIKEFLNR